MIAIAIRCWAASRNIVRSSENSEGIRVAPAMPSRARAMMSICALTEKAATTDIAAKAAEPISISLRGPTLSPRRPMVTRNPAIRKP